MGAAAVTRALEDARFDARQDSRHEDLAADERGRAELAEWERIDQMLAAAAPGAVYDPDTDEVVRAELIAEAAADREAAVREAQRIAARADELQALRELGTLKQAEPREGDEAVRDELTRRAGLYVQADIDPWLAAPWPRTAGTTPTRQPARPPPASCRSRSSRTPRCWPRSPAWSRPPRLASWRS